MNLNDLMSRLQSLFKDGKHTELKEEAEDFLFENEGNAELFLLLAKSSAANGEVAETEYYALKAKAADAGNIEALSMLAALKLQLQDKLGAQHYLEAILKIDANNARANALLGNVFYAEKMFDAAIEKYTAVLNSDAKSQLSSTEYVAVVQHAATAYLNNKDYDAALQILDKYAPEGFNESLTLVKRNIYTAMGPDKLEDVIACVELLQANVPTQPEYILELLLHIDNSADYDRKIALLNKCLAQTLSNQQKMLALRKRAELNGTAGKWAAAVEDYDALLLIAEDWFDYQRRAAMKEQLNDLKGAIQDITQAMKLMQTPSTFLLSTRAKLLLKGGATEKAIEDFTKLLSLSKDDDDADTYFNLGIAYNKLGEKSNAVKMLIRAEMMGHEKAGELLIKSFSEHLIAARQKVCSKLYEDFKAEFERNQRSPILSKAFGQLWVPNMYKFVLSNEAEISSFPGSVIKQMLSDAEKDMFLITPEGLLLFEGEEEPIEAFYKVDMESEHAILIEVQPTKGSSSFIMRLLFHEGNLLLTYPVGEADAPAKYFVKAQELKEEQKQRLTSKKVAIPYMDALESSISKIIKG